MGAEIYYYNTMFMPENDISNADGGYILVGEEANNTFLNMLKRERAEKEQPEKM